MKAAIYEVATGNILYFFEGPDDQAIAQVTSGTWFVEVEDAYGGDTAGHVVSGGEVVPRPRVELPAERTLALHEVWTLHNCPPGSVVRIDGDDVGTVGEDAELALSFGFPGVYALEIVPPPPWMATRCAVTVV